MRNRLSSSRLHSPASTIPDTDNKQFFTVDGDDARTRVRGIVGLINRTIEPAAFTGSFIEA